MGNNHSGLLPAIPYAHIHIVDLWLYEDVQFPESDNLPRYNVCESHIRSSYRNSRGNTPCIHAIIDFLTRMHLDPEDFHIEKHVLLQSYLFLHTVDDQDQIYHIKELHSYNNSLFAVRQQ